MSIIDILSPYKLAAEIAVFGALAGGVVYGIHEFLEHEQDIGAARVQALWDKETADRTAAALKLTADQNAARDLAAQQGADREKTINAAVTASAAAVVSLRNTIASQQAQLSTASIETNRKYSAVASTIFAECSERYRSVAAEAERNANAARTLSDAWPTATITKENK